MSYECPLANVSVNLRQTTISGTTLRRYDQCVGSLTSHRSLSKSCETRPGVYGLSSLPGNRRKSFRCHYQCSTFSPVISLVNTLDDVVTARHADSYPGNAVYNALYGEVPPERDTFLRLQVF